MPDLKALLLERKQFLLLAVLCAVFTGVAGVYFGRSLVRPDTGLVGYYPEVIAREGKIIFFPSAPFSAAMKSGLLPERDRILSVNGMSVGSSWDLFRAVETVRGFDPVAVTVVRDGAHTLTLELAPAFLPARIDWIFILVFCLVLVVTAFILSWRLPQEPGTLPLVLSALLSLLFTCVKPFAYENLAANALFNLGNLGSWLLVMFAMHFPAPRGRRFTRISAMAVVLALFGAFCALRVSLYARWAATGLESFLSLYRLVGRVGNISDGLAYAALAVLLGSAWLRARVPRDRMMLQWLLAGMLIALPPYFFFDQLPLVLGGSAMNVGLGSFAQLFLSLLPIFLLIGLSRNRTFNFRFFMMRYALYGALFLLMIALFFTLYLPLRMWIESGYRVASPLPELFAASIIVLVLASVGILLEWLVSRHLRRSPSAGPDEHRVPQEQARAPAELRTLLRGIVQSLQGPVRLMTAGLAGRGTSQQQEAGARAADFLQKLACATGTSSAIRGSSTAQSVANSALTIIRGRFPAADFRLIGGSAERFSCHAEEIVQAMVSTLENAAEAQEGSAKPIVVHAATEDTRVLIEVADHGPGIDRRAAGRLFNPFFSTKPGHYGLGLYFARMNVEKNDGIIDVAPGEAGGTLARLSFPRIGAGIGSGKES